MTKEEAEQAMHTFEYPGWKCVAVVEHTPGDWLLSIEDRTGERRLMSAEEWTVFWRHWQANTYRSFS